MQDQFYVQLVTEENRSIIEKLEDELEKFNKSHENPGYLRERSKCMYKLSSDFVVVVYLDV